jgi:hypothetical protein
MTPMARIPNRPTTLHQFTDIMDMDTMLPTPTDTADTTDMGTMPRTPTADTMDQGATVTVGEEDMAVEATEIDGREGR